MGVGEEHLLDIFWEEHFSVWCILLNSLSENVPFSCREDLYKNAFNSKEQNS